MPSDFHRVTLIAVDPGLRGCGLAVFRNGVLHHAQYVKNTNSRDRGPVAHMSMAECVAHAAEQCIVQAKVHLIVEFPRIYPGPGKAIDPNDLLDVAGVASAVVCTVASWQAMEDSNCRFVYPSDWKGNIKKEIMTERIRLALTEGERGVIVGAGSKDHNTIDAAGLGLWQLGRLQRRASN